MFKCKDCGLIFDEPVVVKESRGEHFGYPTYEYMNGCPNCFADYDYDYDDDEAPEEYDEGEEYE